MMSALGHPQIILACNHIDMADSRSKHTWLSSCLVGTGGLESSIYE